ncbi:hypothetical protein AA23498_2571 [Acetobacter nitrogenifigens DSM 23921 = NBRC 105050]|uniref:Lipoprotein n=1 Tax=Acetobacter nitrogenifigens DSM 23921 = NBRC 105050 TaxID=1120919 RepID=A0A511X649_9PROT|nr:hypothetical protein [Acetobacter nitrogenifigens]GBQ96186.1 hypothetical protein AA23498_2571 [Acetobacter nitrogenifigens DSM 23921 = NBRC 105050]GEN58412.1 hypothetical protein ANI02nite_02960 [Acetobacter nitrogenifigens DSM 23921 = NBRC 105050]
MANTPCRRTTRSERIHALSLQTALPLATLVTLSACSPAAPFLKTGDELAHSGFTAHYADTTERYAMMNLLPAGMLTYRPTATGPVYLYADRLGCGCVYMGGRSAFAEYSRGHQAPAYAAMTAELNQHPGWDWSVWSGNADPGPSQPRHVIGAEW